MSQKNLLLLCALTAAYAPVVANAPDCFREDEIVDLTKGSSKIFAGLKAGALRQGND